jgi:hypothetical protein
VTAVTVTVLAALSTALRHMGLSQRVLAYMACHWQRRVLLAAAAAVR